MSGPQLRKKQVLLDSRLCYQSTNFRLATSSSFKPAYIMLKDILLVDWSNVKELWKRMLIKLIVKTVVV